jgi:hypothetical protein
VPHDADQGFPRASYQGALAVGADAFDVRIALHSSEGDATRAVDGVDVESLVNDARRQRASRAFQSVLRIAHASRAVALRWPSRAAPISAALHNYTRTPGFHRAGAREPCDMDCLRKLSRAAPEAARYTRPWRVVGARRGEPHA